MSIFDWMWPPIFWLAPIVILLLVFPDQIDRTLNQNGGFDNLTEEKRDPRFYFYSKLWAVVLIFLIVHGSLACGAGLFEGFILPFHVATRGLIDLLPLETFADLPAIFQCN